MMATNTNTSYPYSNLHVSGSDQVEEVHPTVDELLPTVEEVHPTVDELLPTVEEVLPTVDDSPLG